MVVVLILLISFYVERTTREKKSIYYTLVFFPIFPFLKIFTKNTYTYMYKTRRKNKD